MLQDILQWVQKSGICCKITDAEKWNIKRINQDHSKWGSWLAIGCIIYPTYCLNPVDWVIQSVKNHLISILTGADPEYPKDQWDLLLLHAEVTFNISRPSQMNPRISEYTQIYGEVDFNQTPLAPMGYKFIIHYGTDECSSCANHGFCRFYIWPALKHF